VVVERGSLRVWKVLDTEDDLTVFDPRIVRRGDVVRSVLGNDYQVCVRNAVAMNDHTDALGIEDGAHSAADSLCNDHDVCGDAFIDIREMVDVFARDDGAFSGGERAKRHERQTEFIRVDETDRRASGNDLAEYARHRIARFGVSITSRALSAATTRCARASAEP
jgi:hypothetical protein